MIMFSKAMLSVALIVLLSKFRADAFKSIEAPFHRKIQNGFISTETTPPEFYQLQEQAETKARNNQNVRVWNALFFPAPERPTPVPCEPSSLNKWGTIGKNLPSDFPPGCWLRLGPNGGSPDDGFFDADGMVHALTFPPQDTTTPGTTNKNMYSASYIATWGRKLEQQEDKKFKGSLGSAPRGLPLLMGIVENMINFRTFQGMKDTANTALAEHDGRILALMEQSCPSEISVTKTGQVTTVESQTNLNGAIPCDEPLTGGAFSAHGKTCPKTGERVHVSYTSLPPYVRIDVFSGNDGTNDTPTTTQATDGVKGWTLKQSIPVELPKRVPVMIHDCAITENYIIVLDFPLTMRSERLLFDRFPLEYEPQHGARIGLVPRNHDGTNPDSIKWFECTPGVVLHTVNAYEDKESNTVVMHALFSKPRGDASFLEKYATNFLHEWVLDLTTGQTTERCLNPNILPEFPVIDDAFVGEKNLDAVYCANVASVCQGLQVYKTPQEGIMTDGVVKFALLDNKAQGVQKGDVIGRYKLPDQWHCVTEPIVVRKTSGTGNYIILGATKVVDLAPDTAITIIKEDDFIRKSKVIILDGDQLDTPVCTIDLPSVLPYGFHSLFVEWDKLQ